MTTLLEASAVRVKDRSDGAVLGAGFLTDEGIVVTCAHVIADALGIDVTSSICPEQPVTLDFPLVAPGQWLTAKPVRWVGVQPDGGGDIAMLRLEGPAPAGARAAPLVKTDDHWGHPFRAFGYPRKQDDGVPSSGKLTSLNAKGWVVMQTAETTGFRVQQGFSGGAVWDSELDGVAGMVVAEETAPELRVAYMIPSRLLIDAWPPLAQQAIPPCPYRGLAAFREKDSPYFFGRKADTQRLDEAVRRKPLVAVIGSSGSGKSSLVYAGLLPQVRKEASWAIITLRPGATPLRSLAAALLPLLEPQMSALDRLTESRKFSERLMQGDLLFPNIVAALTQGQPAERLVLVVDQLEELYTLCQDAEEQHTFLDALLTAVQVASHQRLPNVALVLTLRADFVAQAITYPPLTAALQESSLFLGPMGRAELQEVITRPAEQLHVQLEEGLTRRLIADAGEAEGNLPLLEFALTSLWVRQQERTLTHAAYEAIGGVQQALTDHARAVYDRLTQDEQHAVRRLFLHHLVRPGEGTQDTRRRATHSQVGREQWPLVAHLADVRLVVTGYDEVLGDETVEVIHEALIRDWALLRGWLDEDRELLLWRERLRTAQRQWEQSGRDPDGLLRGTLLAEAAQWSSARPDALTAEEHGFIQTSQEHEAQTRAHLEALLEESERRRQEAERQQQIALARGLAAQAELLRTEFQHQRALLERSVLLALEAMQRFRCPETYLALSQGVELLRQHRATLRHERSVTAVAFSPNGRLLATASEDDTAGVWEVASGKQLAVLHHERGVAAVAFSPDGRLLATASGDATAGVWEVASGKQLAVLRHASIVYDVTFSPDGLLLATASLDNTAGVWEVASGQHRATLRHEGTVFDVAFSPNGRLLATASLDNTAGVWEVASGKQLAVLHHERGVAAVAFSPDGRLLATASGDATAGVWEVASGQRLAVLHHAGIVYNVAFGPDGRLLATASGDETAGVWEVASGKQLAVLHHAGIVYDVAFSPDGRLLATASAGERLVVGALLVTASEGLITTDSTAAAAGVWEVTSGQRLATLLHEDTVFDVAFSPDGRLLATASGDRTARLRLCLPEDLIAEARSRLSRNLTQEEWQQYLGDEPYRKTVPDLP